MKSRFSMLALLRCYAILAIISGSIIGSCIPALAQCPCVERTREALTAKDPAETMSAFSDNLNHEYSYVGGGGDAGKTIFDLDEDEIRQAYTLMERAPLSSYQENFDSYSVGIDDLRSADTKKSGTYDASKAKLILALDKKLRLFMDDQKILAQDDTTIQSMNANNVGLSVISVEKVNGQRNGYRISDGSNEKLIFGTNPKKLAKELRTFVDSGKTSATTVIFVSRRLSEKDVDALSFNVRMELGPDSKISVHAFYRTQTGSTVDLFGQELQDTLFGSGVSIQELGAVEFVTAGDNLGWFQKRFQTIAKVGDRISKVVLTIYSKSKDTLQKFVNALQARVGGSLDEERVVSGMTTAELLVLARDDVLKSASSDMYLVDGGQFARLNRRGIPADVTDKLQAMDGQTFSSEADFSNQLGKVVTPSELHAYGPKLRKAFKINPENLLRMEFIDEFGSSRMSDLRKIADPLRKS